MSTPIKEQLAIGIDALRPGASWSSCSSYEDLAASWKDASPIPTELEILAAFVAAKRAKLASDVMERFRIKKAEPISVVINSVSRLVPVDTDNLTNLLWELSAMSPADLSDWRMLDGSRVTLNQANLISIRSAVRSRTKALSTAANDLVDLIQSGLRPSQATAESFGLNWSEVVEVTF